MNQVALTQFQKMSSGQTFASVGVRGCVSIKNTPINRVLPPMLHLLLGLGNDVCALFKSFLSERIEQLSQEEKDARDMSFLAETRHGESLIAYDNSKQAVLDLVEQRKEMMLNLSQGDLSKEDKKALNDEKKVVASKIKDELKIRDELDNAAKLKRKDWNDCKKKESKAESDNKNPSRQKVTNYIETVMLKSHRMSK